MMQSLARSAASWSRNKQGYLGSIGLPESLVMIASQPRNLALAVSLHRVTRPEPKGIAGPLSQIASKRKST